MPFTQTMVSTGNNIGYLERFPGTCFPLDNSCSHVAVSTGSSSQEKALQSLHVLFSKPQRLWVNSSHFYGVTLGYSLNVFESQFCHLCNWDNDTFCFTHC